jgi:glucose/mannose-6-phosphate isomerase
MRDAIKNINRQFAFKPKVENAGKLKRSKKFVVCGMGGSNIPTTILKLIDPSLDIIGWNDYGLPQSKDLKDRLVIIVSYSGNTEEAIDSFKEAKRLKLKRAVLATGGRLIELARKEHVAYVQVPNTGIQPRMGTGFMVRGLMKLIGDDKGLRESGALATALNPSAIEAAGKRLGKSLEGTIPVVYASRANQTIAWNWKIKFNETGKIPSFANVLPEMNHNEMTAYDVIPSTRSLSKQLHFIFLEDPADSEHIRLRMKVTRDVYRARGLNSTAIPLEGASIYLKIFSSLVLADWTAFHLAMHYGAEAEKVPMVEDFKKRLK